MSDQNTRYRFWKRTATVVVFAMLIVALSHLYLWYQYAHTRPKLAQPDQGRVYALNTHGLIVYLTKEEQFRLDLLMWTAITLGVCFVSINVFIINPKQKNQMKP